MKNLFNLVIILFLSACITKTDLNLTLLPQNHEIANDDELFSNVIVIDKRKNQKILGKKEYGEEKVLILNDQNLASLVKSEIIYNLKKNNQIIDKNNILEIQISDVRYNSKRGFIGKSSFDLELKARIIDKLNRAEYNKIYNIENKEEYFVISTKSDDEKNINLFLRKAIDQIVSSEKLNIVPQ